MPLPPNLSPSLAPQIYHRRTTPPHFLPSPPPSKPPAYTDLAMATLGDEGDDDPVFLSLVAEAEHRAVRSSAKRPLPYSQPLPPSKAKPLHRPQSGEGHPPPQVEGSYLAALRGAHSPLWRDVHRPNPYPSLPSPPAGSCFRCGAHGHWAKDCTAGELDPPGHVADRDCPCGAGPCPVLTSNTAKNPGRRFYRCPVKEENGGCNFFEWCDGQPSLSGGGGQARGGSLGRGDVKCPCGAGWCPVLTAKGGRNAGQSYFRCPAEGERSCGYFKWCNQDNVVDTYVSTPSNANVPASGGKSGSCFKCGREGHWSRECPMLQSNTSVGAGGMSSVSSNVCFKCGKVGHWARDCSLQAPKTSFLR